MNVSEIARHRLVHQQIAGTKFKTAVELVAWLGAVQAQEYAQTKWGLGMRLPHLTDDDIEKDFAAGNILRTHLLRPTWHFVTARDIRWLLKLTAPRVHAANAYMYRKLELHVPLFNRCNDLLIQTLQGGLQLTRDAINAVFKRNKIEATGLRLSYLMMQAELDGIICSGAREGKQFTYALLEERVPTCKEKNQDEALAELTIRYFTSRGPATVQDFSTWSGLTLTDCKRGLSMVKSNFIQERIGDEEFFFPAHMSAGTTHVQDIYLLPIYDEFIMGYKNRDTIFVFRNKMSPVPALRFDNTIVEDGQIVGTWKRTIQPKRIILGYDFFQPLNKKQDIAFKKAIHHFEAFHKLPVHDERAEV
jgi:hypothetical protein